MRSTRANELSPATVSALMTIGADAFFYTINMNSTEIVHHKVYRSADAAKTEVRLQQCLRVGRSSY